MEINETGFCLGSSSAHALNVVLDMDYMWNFALSWRAGPLHYLEKSLLDFYHLYRDLLHQWLSARVYLCGAFKITVQTLLKAAPQVCKYPLFLWSHLESLNHLCPSAGRTPLHSKCLFAHLSAGSVVTILIFFLLALPLQSVFAFWIMQWCSFSSS